MIDQLGNSVVALDAAQRDDLALMRAMRDAVAQGWAARLQDQRDILDAMKTDAAAQDADIAKAIARREAMLGDTTMQYQQAAE